MEGHVAVTTFSNAGWEVYGHRFVDTFVSHWRIPLCVYHEGLPESLRAKYPMVSWRNVLMQEDRREWLERYDKPPWRGSPNDPNMQAVRFSHKIWAVTAEDRPECRWWIWIDADTFTFTDVDDVALSLFCPDYAALSFLGRSIAPRRGQKPYTEAGFIGYRVEDSRVRMLLMRMREVYTSGELFKLGEHNWHDSYVFDYCRAGSGIQVSEQCNLAAHAQHTMHPWPESALGRYMTHAKGPSRKLKVFGGIVD